MARFYDITFEQTNTGKRVTVRACGNTRRSAERWARRDLREDHKLDPKTCYVVSTVYAGDKR